MRQEPKQVGDVKVRTEITITETICDEDCHCTSEQIRATVDADYPIFDTFSDLGA